MYATVADFVARFGDDEARRLTDLDSPVTGAIVESRLLSALNDSSAEIDSYLSAARISLPLSPTPEILTLQALRLARQSLYSAVYTENDSVNQEANIARRWLQDVARGKAVLASTVEAPVSTEGSAVEVVSQDTGDGRGTFNQTAMEGFNNG